jgi:glycosyltransferase involved in cell wall biosynthesis
MAKPFVSVLIDTYNHEKFIEQAIVSVLEQDFPPAERELLVVDDGSTDRTLEIVRKFAPKLRYLHKPNGGQASAFNLGIPECQGQVVAFLDGDDWWAPGKLTAVARALGDPSIGLVGHGITEAYADGRLEAQLAREDTRFRVDSEAGARTFRVRKSFLGTSRMSFRASVLRTIGPTPEALVIQADEYLFTLGAVLSDTLILREPLTFYRLHDANAFKTADRNVRILRRKQRVLEALSEALAAALERFGLPAEARRLIEDTIRSEAELIRLALDNALPWETVGAELRSYRIEYGEASLGQRLIKLCGLLPACFLPSRVYYSWRQRFASVGAYRRLRQKWLPFPEAAHLDRYHTTRP